MPLLHRTIEAATKEAKELINCYNLKEAFVVQRERACYNLVTGNLDTPAFEALTPEELPHCPNIVAVIDKEDF
jgi:hypothetical protein